MNFSYKSNTFKFIPGPFTSYDKIQHPDYNFAIEHFLKNKSWSMRTVESKPLKILHIYTKNKFQIFMFNIVLFIRFYIRRFINHVKNK